MFYVRACKQGRTWPLVHKPPCQGAMISVRYPLGSESASEDPSTTFALVAP